MAYITPKKLKGRRKSYIPDEPEPADRYSIYITDPVRVFNEYGRTLTPDEITHMRRHNCGFNPTLGIVSKTKLQRIASSRTDTSQNDQTDTESTASGSSDTDPQSQEFQVVQDSKYQDCYIYSDVVPIRNVAVTSWRREAEQHAEPPYTTFFQALSERLNDPSASSALMSTIRGPTVRDSASIIGLARFLKGQSESFKECAALVRAYAVAAATTVSAYAKDPVTFKPIRRFIPDYTKSPQMLFKKDNIIKNAKMLAVPLDIAVAMGLNKLNTEAPAPYNYASMDVDWTMVPIRQTALNTMWILPYIISFLDSGFWNGMINWVQKGTWYNEDMSTKVKEGTITLMPHINSIRVPGPKHVLLVLMDCTSGSPPNNISISNGNGVVQVPVWTGQNRQNIPAGLSEAWNNYVGQQAANLPTHFVTAAMEICHNLAVADTCGIALSAAAELYVGQYPGMAMSPNNEYSGYGEEAKGGWSFGGGYVDPKEKKIKTTEWPDLKPSDNFDKLRQQLIGFNFSVQTPYHVTPISATKITYQVMAEDNAEDRIKHVQVCWSVNGYDGFLTYDRPQYSIPTTSSLMRLSVYAGLISVHGQGYSFKLGAALANWLNMLSAAIALSTANFLSANDLSVRLWMGWPYSTDMNILRLTQQRIMTTATVSLVTWTNMQQVLTSSSEWAWNCIDEYYGGIEPDTNMAWAITSNWPVHAILQWANKIELLTNAPPMPPKDYVTDEGHFFVGLEVEPSQKQWNGIAAATIDYHRYQPIEIYHIVGNTDGALYLWVDRWSYDSNSGLSGLLDPNMYTSSLNIVSISQKGYVTARNNFYFIINSRLSYSGDSFKNIHVSPIEYPDPPSFSDFLSAMRDFVLIPGIAGLGGFLTTGNPVVGLGVAGTTLAQAIGTHTGAAKIKAATKESASKITEALERSHMPEPDAKMHESKDPSVGSNLAS